MHQLVLPLDELMADDMELAFWTPYRGIDWGFIRGSEFVGYVWRAAGKSYYEEMLGQWKDDKQSWFSEYDIARYRALGSTKPWTQLLLPLSMNYKREHPTPKIRGRAAHWVAHDLDSQLYLDETTKTA